MTTLVVVRKNNEVAIAADSLTTFGDTRLSARFDRISDKIVRYHDTYVGLCGSAAHQLVFESLLAQHKDLDLGSKAAIFETFRKLHPILKEQHFLNPKEEEDDPYESTQVTAVIANSSGIFGVYSMREVFEYTQYWAVGSGREFALGAMQAETECTTIRLRALGTEAVGQLVAAEARAQLSMLHGPLPEKSTGDHCSSPERCPFWDRCWTPSPPYDLSTMYRAGKKLKEWAAKGWRSIMDLPEDLPLNPVATRQVAAVRTGRMQVEADLASALAAFVGPLAFLDFETVSPAIPRWTGCGPYCPVPVQLSCHLEDGIGHRHVEWLAEGPGDPRLEFTRFLVEACAGARTIVSYNAGFEADCLRRLAEALPQLAPELTDVERRLVDLLPVVRDHVYHPSFAGGFSLKQVLPALVPAMGYSGMEVAEGRAASRELMQLLFGEPMDPQERSVIRESLLAYCKQDTWAMVRLLQRLGELAIDGG